MPGNKPRYWFDLVVAYGFSRLARQYALSDQELADYCRDRADAAFARAEMINELDNKNEEASND